MKPQLKDLMKSLPINSVLHTHTHTQTGLPLPGRRRLLFLCLVRLVSTAARVKAPAEKPRRGPGGQHPAGSGRAACASDLGASVPSAPHGALTAH